MKVNTQKAAEDMLKALKRNGVPVPVDTSGTRTVISVYYQGKTVVKKTYAKYANNAVPNSVKHLQLGAYDATHVEVYDEASGVLHAVVKRFIGSNEIRVLFKREVKETY